jgi:hypothetical protein
MKPETPWRGALIGAAIAGLFLAQMNAPGASSNLGVPALSGTRTPEQSPATAVPSAPSYGADGVPSPASGAGAAAASPSPPSGPAYSFGAAPPPITAPSR